MYSFPHKEFPVRWMTHCASLKESDLCQIDKGVKHVEDRMSPLVGVLCYTTIWCPCVGDGELSEHLNADIWHDRICTSVNSHWWQFGERLSGGPGKWWWVAPPRASHQQRAIWGSATSIIAIFLELSSPDSHWYSMSRISTGSLVLKLHKASWNFYARLAEVFGGFWDGPQISRLPASQQTLEETYYLPTPSSFPAFLLCAQDKTYNHLHRRQIALLIKYWIFLQVFYKVFKNLCLWIKLVCVIFLCICLFFYQCKSEFLQQIGLFSIFSLFLLQSEHKNKFQMD